MSDAERNYDVREKEFMALLRACLHWRHYLHGTQPFTLLTDHDSLKYHKTMPHLSGRLARWIEKMAEFDYVLQHIPGKDNVVADALSRRADHADQAPRQVNALRGILKKEVRFATSNRYEALSAVRAPSRAPEPAEQRQRNIDAATKVLPRAVDAPRPNKAGRDPHANAALHGGHQPRRAMRAADGCGSPVLEPPAARHGRAGQAVVRAGRGQGLVRCVARWARCEGHRIPYTGDAVVLRSDEHGGPYVLQTKRGAGIDAARRNCGLGRWVNDPARCHGRAGPAACRELRVRAAHAARRRAAHSGSEDTAPHSEGGGAARTIRQRVLALLHGHERPAQAAQDCTTASAQGNRGSDAARSSGRERAAGTRRHDVAADSESPKRAGRSNASTAGARLG